MDAANPSPLASATPEQLDAWARLIEAMPFGTQFEALRAAADLLRAVAKMARHGAFVDGGAMPWTLALGNNVHAVATDAPSLPAALAALLEEPTR